MTAPRRALIVVDVQQEYFDGILQIQARRAMRRLPTSCARSSRTQHDLPVVVVQHELPEGSPVFAVGSESWRSTPRSSSG